MSNTPDTSLTSLSAFDTLSPADLRDKFRASIVLNEAKREKMPAKKAIDFSPGKQQMLTHA
jgi:hypothetical protein